MEEQRRNTVDTMSVLISEIPDRIEDVFHDESVDCDIAVVVITWPDSMDDTIPQKDHLIDENDVTVDNTVHVNNTFPIDNTVPLDNLELDGVTISIDDVEFINDSVPMDNDTVTDTVPLQNINMDSSKQKNNQIRKRCEVCQKEVNIKSISSTKGQRNVNLKG